MTRKCFVVCVIVFIIAAVLSAVCVRNCSSATINSERWYQSRVCNSMFGVMEVVTDSGTRCDCLTDEYAIEFDFAHKWPEAIGQALDYSARLGKTPGVVLIVEDESEQRFVEELLFVNEKWKLGIVLWEVLPDASFKRRN